MTLAMKKLSIALALSSMMLGACSSPGGSSGSGSPTGTADSKAAASGDAKAARGDDTKPAKADEKAAPKKLDKLGLTIDVPADASVNEMGDSVMVSAGSTAVSIKVATDTDPKTVDDGKSSALLGDKGRNLKGDKTKDGWIVTWENTGSAGDNYWLSMRREINKKGYLCETTVSNEDQRKTAIAMCNSLR